MPEEYTPNVIIHCLIESGIISLLVVILSYKHKLGMGVNHKHIFKA